MSFAGFRPSQFNTLKTIKFIPTLSTLTTTGNEAAVLMAPENVYVGDGALPAKRGYFLQLFVYVDFGKDANTFLRSCGILDEPSPDQVCSNFMVRRS